MKLAISHFDSKPFHEEQNSNLNLGCIILALQASNSFVTPPLMNCTRFHTLKPSIQCFVHEHFHFWHKGAISILIKHNFCNFSLLEPCICFSAHTSPINQNKSRWRLLLTATFCENKRKTQTIKFP